MYPILEGFNQIKVNCFKLYFGFLFKKCQKKLYTYTLDTAKLIYEQKNFHNTYLPEYFCTFGDTRFSLICRKYLGKFPVVKRIFSYGS